MKKKRIMTILDYRLVSSCRNRRAQIELPTLRVASAPSLNCALATCIIHYIHSHSHSHSRSFTFHVFAVFTIARKVGGAERGGEAMVIIAYYGNWVQ